MALPQTKPQSKVRVLLIGDPPAGDKVEAQLLSLDWVELKYVRNPHSHHAFMDAVQSGLDYVLAMNAKSAGAMLKERCRQKGVKMVAIPPSWSKTKELLDEVGFFARITTTSPNGDALKYRPFADLKEPARLVPAPTVTQKPPPPKMPEVTKAPVQAAPVPPPPPTKPAPAVSAQPAPKPPPPPAPTPIAKTPEPVEERKVISKLTDRDRALGRATNASDSAARMALAERLFTEGPDLDPHEVNRQIVMSTGAELSSGPLYRIRREVRARMGLPPAPGTKKANRVEQPTESAAVMSPPPEPPKVVEPPKPVPQAPAPTPAAAPGLSEDMRAAQEMLAEAVRKMGAALHEYSFVFRDGKIKATHKMAVVKIVEDSTSL